MRAHVLLASAAAMLVTFGLSGCGSKCGPDNCSGCCDGNDHCQIPTDATCGLNGTACTACVGAQHCQALTGQCEFLSATGGGNGNGNGGNGGSNSSGTTTGNASGSTSSGTTTGGGSTTSGTTGTTGSTSAGTTGFTTTGTGGTTGATTTTGGTTGTCSATATPAQQLPVDMYLMLDQSGSMSDATGTGASKWDAVTTGIESFVQQPSTAGLSLGLQYFALPGGCPALCDNTTDYNSCINGGGTCDGANGTSGNCVGCFGTDSCTAADYASPEVEIAALPGNASAINNSIAQHSPSTSTPTSAALQGAITHAQAWAQAHSGHTVVDILATDGDPTECDTNMSDIDAIAAAGLSASPSIQTFVIGVGSSLSNLNSIAASGGTGQAYIIDTTGNVNQQMLQDMNQIRLSAQGCAYVLPSSATNPALVNVQYAPSNGGPAVVFPNVSGSSACPSGNAWYYDNPTAPTKVVLCPASCSTVGSDPGGLVDVLTGCPTTH